MRAFLALTALAALASAPVASADSRPLPGGEFVECVVHDLTTPPPEEPHTPMPCPSPGAATDRSGPPDLDETLCRVQVLIRRVLPPDDDTVVCLALPPDGA